MCPQISLFPKWAVCSQNGQSVPKPGIVFQKRVLLGCGNARFGNRTAVPGTGVLVLKASNHAHSFLRQKTKSSHLGGALLLMGEALSACGWGIAFF